MADATSNTGPAALVGQLGSLWKKQSGKRRGVLVAAIVGILAIVAATQFLKHETTWTPVAEGASPDDSQELLATLEARGITARLVAGKVEVTSDKLDEARAAAAAAGLPRTGKGFEIFDGASLGQSSFAEQVNYRRALEGELSRSIAAMAQVQQARVHLALGKHSVFKEQEEPPSASVALHLHPGQSLTNDQVDGVRAMVAASIEGMKPGAVVIVDNHGNLLDAGPSGSGDTRASLETTLTLRIRTMLERVVGVGKVAVSTTAVVDESKVSETEELYDNTNPVIRSESRTIDGAGAAAAATTQNNMATGVAGTTGTLQGTPPSPGGGSGSSNERMSETKNYEVSRTVRQTTKPDSKLTQLHIAIVVDYKTGADGKPVARTEPELAELMALAKQAAGVDDARGDKIELRSIPFVADPDANLPPPVVVPKTMLQKLPLVPIGAGAGGLVVLIALVVMLRSGKQSKSMALVKSNTMNFAMPVPVGELERVLEQRQSHPALASSDAPALPAGRQIRDRVLDAVRGDVERTAEVLTSWLSEVPAAKGAK